MDATNNVGKHFFQTNTCDQENNMKEMLTRIYNYIFTETGFMEWSIETYISQKWKSQKMVQSFQMGNIRFTYHLEMLAWNFQTRTDMTLKNGQNEQLNPLYWLPPLFSSFVLPSSFFALLPWLLVWSSHI